MVTMTILEACEFGKTAGGAFCFTETKDQYRYQPVPIRHIYDNGGIQGIGQWSCNYPKPKWLK